MATYVPANIQMSATLTTGEMFCICAFNYLNIQPDDSKLRNFSTGSLDWSTIIEINCTLTTIWGGNISGTPSAGAYLKNSSVVIAYPTISGSGSFSDTRTTDISSVTSGNFTISCSGGSTSATSRANFKINSFTTIDGKIHTPQNLNY